MTRLLSSLTLLLSVLSPTVAGPPPAPADIAPARGEKELAARAVTSARVAWEVPLPASPIAPPLIVADDDGSSRVLLAMPGAVEARALDDGRLVWRREDLDGPGLHRPADPTSSTGPLTGWAGAGEDGSPLVTIFSVLDGADVVSRALPGAPVGPPFPARQDDGSVIWHVPLEGGRVLVLDATLGLARETRLGERVEPRLVSMLGRAAAFVDESSELRWVDGMPARRAPRGIAAETATVDDGWLFAAGDREVCAWRCRTTKRDRLSCRRRWCQDLGASITAPPRVVGNLLVVGSWDTFLYAFDKENGHLAWRLAEGQRLTRPALPWRGLLLVIPEASPRVTAVEPRSGRVITRLRGERDESFPAGGAAARDTLVVPVTKSPNIATLRAWTLSDEERDAGDDLTVTEKSLIARPFFWR